MNSTRVLPHDIIKLKIPEIDKMEIESKEWKSNLLNNEDSRLAMKRNKKLAWYTDEDG